MFGLPTQGRVSGRRRINVIAAEMNRPVHLTGAAAAALVARVLDPNDPFGKAKPIPWPEGATPVVMAGATTSG
jgi:hypothetical protein